MNEKISENMKKVLEVMKNFLREYRSAEKYEVEVKEFKTPIIISEDELNSYVVNLATNDIKHEWGYTLTGELWEDVRYEKLYYDMPNLKKRIIILHKRPAPNDTRNRAVTHVILEIQPK